MGLNVECREEKLARVGGTHRAQLLPAKLALESVNLSTLNANEFVQLDILLAKICVLDDEIGLILNLHGGRRGRRGRCV
jgi:hypothetical protein